MSFWNKLLQNFVWERAIARVYFFSELTALYIAVQQLPGSEFYVTFYTIRVLFLVIARIFSFIRKSPRFYFAGFREMPVEVYWRFVIFTMLVMKGMFLHKFADLSSTIQMIDLALVTGIIGSLLMSYQGQAWATNKKEKRVRRIEHLSMRRAKLSKAEFEAITPVLIKMVAHKQRQPSVWKLTKVILVVIWGATLSAYAGTFADVFEIKFNNLLPPF